MDLELYKYCAKVMSVYDGDTIRVDIDLGLKTWIKNESIRLNRINAPEGKILGGNLARKRWKIHKC